MFRQSACWTWFYSASFFFITDKDECATDQHDCAEGMVCQNMIGGYDCVCPTGFKATNEVPPCEGQYNVETLK